MTARARAESVSTESGLDGPWTVLRLMLWSADYLKGKGIERGRLDAEYLLAHVLGLGRLEMYLQHERPLQPAELDAFRPLLKRRAAREPLQYILGRSAFRDLELAVGPDVLIPRPETEVLVQVVLDWARRRPRGGLTALDVGTGSGAIALSLLTEGPFEHVTATDSSRAALDVAGRNRDELGVGERLHLRLGSYYDAVRAGERFDVVVSNPPYVAERDRNVLAPEVVDWEPAEALFAGPEGLSVLERLVAGAPRVLEKGGLLALEVGHDQAAAVVGLAREAGLEAVEAHRDLAGRERIVTASKAPDLDD